MGSCRMLLQSRRMLRDEECAPAFVEAVLPKPFWIKVCSSLWSNFVWPRPSGSKGRSARLAAGVQRPFGAVLVPAPFSGLESSSSTTSGRQHDGIRKTLTFVLKYVRYFVKSAPIVFWIQLQSRGLSVDRILWPSTPLCLLVSAWVLCVVASGAVSSPMFRLQHGLCEDCRDCALTEYATEYCGRFSTMLE